jgi:hypothetical protein
MSERGFKSLTMYGLTMQDYNRMVCKQRGRCAICFQKLTANKNGTNIDHCHKTGKVRGLLCSGCNKRLGWAEKKQVFTNRQLHYLSI